MLSTSSPSIDITPEVLKTPQKFENLGKCLRRLGEGSNMIGKIVLLPGVKDFYYLPYAAPISCGPQRA